MWGWKMYPMLYSGLNRAVPTERLHSSDWAFVSDGVYAGLGMVTDGIREYDQAAINCFYNTPERMEELDCYRPYENPYTSDIDFTGKRVGVVGYLSGLKTRITNAADIRFIEKRNIPGCFPEEACEFILPESDIVIITGSAFINGTMEHLLELAGDAYTVVTGPSTPMCPELFDLGINRLAGFVATDVSGLRQAIIDDHCGSPYRFGESFVLDRN